MNGKSLNFFISGAKTLALITVGATLAACNERDGDSGQMNSGGTLTPAATPVATPESTPVMPDAAASPMATPDAMTPTPSPTPGI